MWGWTPLFLAIHQGKTECVQYLVESGADVNLADSNGVTPLMWLEYSRDNAVPLVDLLIAHGADLDAKDKDGLTALSYAEGDPPAPELIATIEAAEGATHKRQAGSQPTAVAEPTSRVFNPDTQGTQGNAGERRDSHDKSGNKSQ
jgi:ankyrin repeat protein